EDRIENRRVDLGEVLVREHHPDAVLPEFREHGGKALGREGVELIEVEKERTPTSFGFCRAAQASESNVGDQKRSHESRGVIPEPALGEIDNEDLSLVHHRAKVKARVRLGEDA